MMLYIISAITAAISLSTAFPTYKLPAALPRIMLEDDSCVFPESYLVEHFNIWTPSAGNGNSTIINFQYTDIDTSIQTPCHFNVSSINVGVEGLAPRYACDNTIVEFIWQNNTLRMIEKTCPETSSGFEASGSIQPQVDCFQTPDDLPIGPGTDCFAVQDQINGTFSSLQPTPK
ncbi:hypothetical protein B0T25DRAFT_907 [Lasiosphaeria hispida]|uniref:AA1-like domain-containing protein n=1 Tax=Lasiosphaeria hispida TaxID=260671 RepID=A0AAJ0HSU1_9PEZI|nr:hypothetical protein B0T25DRAFT_907 [Lasiosphaeria hispida]